MCMLKGVNLGSCLIRAIVSAVTLLGAAFLILSVIYGIGVIVLGGLL